MESYYKIIEDLKNSLTDENRNAKNFIFTSSYLDLYRKADSKILAVIN